MLRAVADTHAAIWYIFAEKATFGDCYNDNRRDSCRGKLGGFFINYVSRNCLSERERAD
jgi:hypothetical protein